MNGYVSSGAWSAFVTHSEGMALASGTYTIRAGISDLAGNAATTAMQNLMTDATIPSVVSISVSPTAADLGIGQLVTLTMTLSEAVTVTTVNGTPTLTLSDGGTAAYVSGSGTTQLVFDYTVQAGDNSSGLGVTASSLNGGIIADAAGNAADLSGAIGNLTGLLTIDTTPPVVLSVTTSPSNGDIGLGQTVTLTVNMSQAVSVSTVNGTPTLQLNNGGIATYVSGSGTTQLLFSYTVGAGQDTADLTVTGLTLNNGTIADLAGNVATLTGAITNPAGTLQIDSTPPVIAITPISAPINAATLNAGFTITGTTNAEDGQVATVRLQLVDINGNIVDSYTAPVSGGIWSARVTHGQGLTLADGTYTLTASIQDLAGNTSTQAVQTLVIDATAPVVSIAAIDGNNTVNAAGLAAGFAITGTTTDLADGQSTIVTILDASQTVIDTVSAPVLGGSWSATIPASVAQGLSDGLYTVRASATDTAGNVSSPVSRTLKVDTMPPVIAIGDPGPIDAATLDTGFAITGTTTAENGQIATVQLVNGNNVVVDTYTASAIAGAWSIFVTHSDGLALASGTYTIRAGISDLAGNAATTATQNLITDAVIPRIVAITASPATADLGIGQLVTLTMTLSKAVTVTTVNGTPTITLSDGGTAAYVSGSGTTQLVFDYTVQAGDNSSGLGVTASSLNGGIIADAAGNAADLSGAIGTLAGLLTIDTTPPVVLSVTTSPSNGDIGLGQTVTLTVNVSQAVSVSTVNGTPTLQLNNGGIATYVSGSGTSQLLFSYTVGAGQDTADLTVTGLTLNNGTIADLAGNVPTLTGAITNPAGTLQIDSTPPVIAIDPVSFAINATELDAGFTITGTTTAENGQIATVRIQLVDVHGTVVDSYTTPASGGVWSARITHGQGLTLADGTYTVTAAICDLAGNLSTLATQSITVDATPPTVLAVATSPADGDLGIGQVVTLSLTMSEAVTVALGQGTPTLTLNNGATATYIGGSGTNQLAFSYTVAAGDDIGDLAVSSVALNGGVIADAAGNAAYLAGAAINPPGTLAIDTTPPIVSLVTAVPNATGVGIGQTVPITLNMSQAVIVSTANGTPTLQLNNGGTATYVSGSGTTQLVFDYTVAAGQDTNDLTVTGITLNNGSIADLAGNAANLAAAIANPAGTLRIDATPPAITITPLAGTVDAAMLNAGFTVTGTTTAEDGQIATVMLHLVNSSGQVVESYTAPASGGVWSTQITHAQGLLLADGSYTLTAAIADLAGNTSSVATNALTIDATPPSILQITTSPANGDLDIGQTVTLTLTMSEAVTVATSGGIPTLALDNGGTATYTGGSGTSNLTFSYTVAADQDTPDLTVNGMNLNGGTVADLAGNPADLSGAAINPEGTLAIGIETPTGLTLQSAGVAFDGVLHTNTTSPTVTGVAIRNSVIRIFSGATQVGTGVANAQTGAFAVATSGLASGANQVTVTATSPAGTVSAASDPLPFVVDTVAPDAPNMWLPQSDSTNGSSSSTSSSQPMIEGQAEAGSTIALYDGTQLVGTTIANSITGSWTIVTTQLTAGDHILRSTAADTAGNVSSASDTLSVNVTNILPISAQLANDTGSDATDNLTNDSSLKGIAAAGSTVTLSDGTTILYSVLASADGLWSASAADLHLADGAHTLTVTDTDNEGRSGSTQIAFDLKTSITAAMIANLLTNDTAPTITGTAEAGASVAIIVDGQNAGSTVADTVSGSWSYAIPTNLALGAHQIAATETDSAGNSFTTANAGLLILPAPVNGVTDANDTSLDYVHSVVGTNPTLQFVAGTNSVQIGEGIINSGPDTQESYVVRLYETLFNTNGDLSGVSFRNNFLSQTSDKVMTAQGFLDTPEGMSIANGLTNSQFVDLLYNNGLDRGSEAAGKAFWLQSLENGATRAQVLAGFADSEESKVVQASATNQIYIPDWNTQIVTFTYQAAFNRMPEASGLDYWAQLMQNGLTVQEFEASFTASPEFQSDYGDNTSSQTIAPLYQNGLGRAPSASEIQAASTQTNASLLKTIVLSPEASIHLQTQL